MLSSSTIQCVALHFLLKKKNVREILEVCVTEALICVPLRVLTQALKCVLLRP
jgi:hypothetical protein